MATVVDAGFTTVTTTVVQFIGGEVQIGGTGGKVGFFGKSPIGQLAGIGITDFATLKVGLQGLGLISTP